MKTWKKWITVGMTLTIGASALTGCGKKGADTEPKNNRITINSETSKNSEASEEETRKESQSVSESETTETVGEKEDNSSVFYEMSRYGYTFASGAGAWSTELQVYEDGSFDGGYSDSDLGDTGADYPNGVIYVSGFSGQFAPLEKVNEYTYKTSIQTIRYEEDPNGKEEIKDGKKYIYTTAYGLDGAEDLYIYTKGAPISQLPEGYLSWISVSGLEDGTKTLPWYGIYNEKEEEGFFGYLKGDEEVSEDLEDLSGIMAELAQIDEKAGNIQDQLASESLSQGDMNTLSAQLYTLWDDELNVIWKRLKDTLDQDTMKQITQEEREWIKMKEEKVQEEGRQWEGGSGQKSAENLVEADLTRDRVYELAQYLR